ncbi:MAG: winged helix-turn-helix domain-containing protein [Armatimonadota bacterium]
MRYTSAMTIIRHMRRNFGKPLSISDICRGVDLSYQPVHFHVKQLQELSVLSVEKSGRESLCRFTTSEASALWLGLLTQANRRHYEGLVKELADGLAGDLRESWSSYQCVSVCREQNSLIAVNDEADETSITSACEEISPALDVRAVDRDDFLDFLQTAEGIVWIRSSAVLLGHQRFWQYALHAGFTAGLVAHADPNLV